uniref:Uncharacterized protein n=1 Tax=Picea glauca TaxID=3330 RepID=A0A117NFJ7_PICGL|nr:hypothetical protein ABT39_MTgene3476 [Picea glauca]
MLAMVIVYSIPYIYIHPFSNYRDIHTYYIELHLYTTIIPRYPYIVERKSRTLIYGYILHLFPRLWYE